MGRCGRGGPVAVNDSGHGSEILEDLDMAKLTSAWRSLIGDRRYDGEK
jgi:hypothetical protein